MNDEEIHSSEDHPTDLVLGVAEGRITKSEVAVFLQKWRDGSVDGLEEFLVVEGLVEERHRPGH